MASTTGGNCHWLWRDQAVDPESQNPKPLRPRRCSDEGLYLWIVGDQPANRRRRIVLYPKKHCWKAWLSKQKLAI